MSETIVTQNYTRTQNVSVTVRDGRIDKVTLWQTGVPSSTVVVAETTPVMRLAQKNVFKSRGGRVRV